MEIEDLDIIEIRAYSIQSLIMFASKNECKVQKISNKDPPNVEI